MDAVLLAEVLADRLTQLQRRDVARFASLAARAVAEATGLVVPVVDKKIGRIEVKSLAFIVAFASCIIESPPLPPHVQC